MSAFIMMMKQCKSVITSYLHTHLSISRVNFIYLFLFFHGLRPVLHIAFIFLYNSNCSCHSSSNLVFWCSSIPHYQFYLLLSYMSNFILPCFKDYRTDEGLINETAAFLTSALAFGVLFYSLWHDAANKLTCSGTDRRSPGGTVTRPSKQVVKEFQTLDRQESQVQSGKNSMRRAHQDLGK